jgi:flagellar FliJ protein
MSRFRFRLDPVLDVRTKIEQLVQNDVARAESALVEAESHQATVSESLALLIVSIRDRHRILEIEDLRTSYARLEYLQREVARAASLVEEAQSLLAHARSRLIEARRNRKVLESLKDRKRAAYEHEESQAEHRAIDDVNGRRNFRYGVN